MRPMTRLLLPIFLILPPALWADNWKNYNDAASKARERKKYQEAEKLYKVAIAEV